MIKMNKVISMADVISQIKDGASLMIGGFAVVGTPPGIIEAILEAGIKDLTIISNDTGFDDRGLGVLITQRRVKKVIASHIGMNKQTGLQMNEGSVEVELIPQGTLVERIRAAAFGLGGVLTPTGLGTAVQEGKEVLNVDGKDYLLEKPLTADFALLYGEKVDKAGNIAYRGAQVNFNHCMAGAAAVTIVEAGELVEIGGIDPNEVVTPGIFVDFVVGGK
jgi:acetate CoA/acetoacetate CoA-transferase alpha subunit